MFICFYLKTPTKMNIGHRAPQRNAAHRWGSSTVEEKEKKNTIGGDPKICAPKMGKINEGSLEEKREGDREL